MRRKRLSTPKPPAPHILTRMRNTVREERNVHMLNTNQIAKVLKLQHWDVQLDSVDYDFHVGGTRRYNSYIVKAKAITMVATKNGHTVVRNKNTTIFNLCTELLQHPAFNTSPLSLTFKEIATL